MTRKDYIKLANLISWNGKVKSNKVFLNDLASMLKSDNQKFDKERFINACQKN
jgi:hypothetical protein|tara:strand:+ start:25 stop:183 length:159 start_codon:yes stop_codon:yes gene_type:complete